MPAIYGTGLKPTKYPFPHDRHEKKYYTFNYRPVTWSPGLEVSSDGDVVMPTTPTGFMNECVSSGVTDATEPAPWATVEEEETVDGTAVFMAVTKSVLLRDGDTITDSSWAIDTDGAYWEADTLVEVGDIIAPLTANNHRFVCTEAGTTTNGAEPVWDISSEGALTEDGTATFKAEFVGEFDNDAIVGGEVTRFRLTGVPRDATSISITNSVTIVRANTDEEEYNRTIVIPIKKL